MKRKRRPKADDSINPTPEEVLAAVQVGFPEIFEGAGATMRKVAELTAQQLRAERWVKLPGQKKYTKVPDWTQVNAGCERTIRINGAYAPERKSHTLEGPFIVGWDTDHEE